MNSLIRPLALASLLVAGCSVQPPDASGSYTVSPGDTTSYGDARISISWTIAGAEVSAAACAGVDHLRLEVNYDGGESIYIDPIPCTIGKLRYDGMPQGLAAVDLIAISASSCRLADGQARVDVEPTLPTTPYPVDIPALGNCP